MIHKTVKMSLKVDNNANYKNSILKLAIILKTIKKFVQIQDKTSTMSIKWNSNLKYLR
jgi:hypothetical protein